MISFILLVKKIQRVIKRGNFLSEEGEETKNLIDILIGENGGPLLEEALLIGMGIVIFVVIVNIVSDLTTWLKHLSEDLPTMLLLEFLS